MNGHSRLPRLDGFRGLALLLIAELHLILWPPSFGLVTLKTIRDISWIGVDLFFVLSGFLITGILFDKRGQTARRYFTNFFARRALRVMPLYFLFLIVWFLLVDDPTGRLNEQMPWFALYGIGIWVGITGQAIYEPLAHLWTLAVEEHFYFLWPFAMFFVPARHLKKFCIAGLVATFLFRMMALSNDMAPYSIFILTPFRMDGFFAGGLAALVLRDKTFDRSAVKRFSSRTALVCALALATIFAFRGALLWADPAMQTIGYSILECGLAAWLLAIVLGDAGSLQSRIFESRFLRTLGKYSYAFYIFHYPIHIAIFQNWTRSRLGAGDAPLAVFLHATIVALASFALALLSWRLIEAPVLRLKSRFD